MWQSIIDSKGEFMLWSEVKKWAKEKGYDTIKDKEDGQYYWAKTNDDIEASGVAKSVSKLATAIFNHITQDKFVEYQLKFKEEKEYTKFTLSNYGS
jgi:hypothetical protein